MYLQTAFYAFKCADGRLHRRRFNPVGKGNCGRCNAVFGIHPAGSSHAYVLYHATGIVEVIVEVTAVVGAGITGIEIGR